MTPRAMAVFVICFAVVAIAIGSSFFVLGYWLILPFTGLEIAIVAASVALTIRRSRDFELVTVSEQKVTVIRRYRGQVVSRNFQRYWTQVRQEMGTSRLHPSHLLIGSHGQFVAIGKILTEEMKDKLARQIRDALRYHRPENHNNVSE